MLLVSHQSLHAVKQYLLHWQILLLQEQLDGSSHLFRGCKPVWIDRFRWFIRMPAGAQEKPELGIQYYQNTDAQKSAHRIIDKPTVICYNYNHQYGIKTGKEYNYAVYSTYPSP